MFTQPFLNAAGRLAVVAKSVPQDADSPRYLLIGRDSKSTWVDDPAAATAFPSMREALRMTMRMPSQERAYGMLRDQEISAHLH